MDTAILFPGQGSQAVGMGQALFDRYPEEVALASDRFDLDVQHVCTHGPEALLQRTDITQAVVFLVNALSYYEWKKTHAAPQVVLGHSVGEYNALVAAGVISLDDGLQLVRARGELMAQQQGGAMAAVLKMSSQDVEASLAQIDYGDQVDIANYNSEYQTVVSTQDVLIDSVMEGLQSHGALCVKLRTGGAFHSRYMQDAKTAFIPTLKSVTFHRPKISVVCNLTGRESVYSEGAELGEHLTSPVLWYPSIYHVLESYPGIECVECGYGNTLSNILRYNKKEHQAQLALA